MEWQTKDGIAKSHFFAEIFAIPLTHKVGNIGNFVHFLMEINWKQLRDYLKLKRLISLYN